MEYMEWDDTLATHAQQYSDMCIWAHGFPDVNITPFNPVGQNLWNAGPVTESDRPNPAYVVQSWFNERDYYDYSSGTCDDGYDCGHYTQVVWHSSSAVGCGLTFCPTASETEDTNIMLVVCHYGEAGNYAGEKPYTSGTPCTKCASGIGQCYENNCRPCSDPNDASCVCAQVCENCGTLDVTACKCDCFWGYNLADCSARCIDNALCGTALTYSRCNTDASVRQNCPAMCGDCFEYLPQFFACDADTAD
ncbi:peptidase inhibitor 16-like [Asterias rubens]|uniref:peptidase inhibitor 16-like n=1 Tax=Asterias rubens TaxID=7604 RepID=UPI001455B71E|nr:peptidase inhibitor 16-like [Asterias rubens]